MFTFVHAGRYFLQPVLVSAVRYDVRLLSSVVCTNGKLLQGIDIVHNETRTVQEGNVVRPKTNLPLNPFMQFMKENMQKLHKENPGKAAPSLIKLIAVAYKELPEADRKQRYAAYTEELKKYREKLGQPVKLTKDELIHRIEKRIRLTKFRIARLSRKLDAPLHKAQKPHGLYVREHFKRVQASGDRLKQEEVLANFGQAIRAYKELPFAEKEQLLKQCLEENKKSLEVHQRWLQQLEADSIDLQVPAERRKLIANYFLLQKRMTQLKKRSLTVRESMRKLKNAEERLKRGMKEKVLSSTNEGARETKSVGKAKKSGHRASKKEVEAKKGKKKSTKAKATPKVSVRSRMVDKKKTTEAAGTKKTTGATGTKKTKETSGTKKTAEAAGTKKTAEAAGTKKTAEAAGTKKTAEAAKTKKEAAGTKKTAKAAGTKKTAKAAETKNQAEATGTKNQAEATGTKNQAEAAGTKNPAEAAGSKKTAEATESNSSDTVAKQ